MPKKKFSFVDVAAFGFISEPRYYFYGWSRSARVFGRESAVQALLRAKKSLPKGYSFKVWDCRRPRSVQLTMLDSFFRRFRSQYPRASKSKIEEMVFRFGMKPSRRITRLDTHRNGGSFDLTIVDRAGGELYMGTDHDDLTQKAATDYFESKTSLLPRHKEAKKNRRLLSRVMIKAGFINYAREWWHWSYPK
ncbi:MAG: M15 family metallopeptidase [bacterium]|nr:M15 family metallopeptidase [bacterium]